MNKIYKLCEYKIPCKIVKRLTLFTPEELIERVDDLFKGMLISEPTKIRYKNIILSDEFKFASSDSIYELLAHNFKESDVKFLFKQGFSFRDILEYNPLDYYYKEIPDGIANKIKHFQKNRAHLFIEEFGINKENFNFVKKQKNITESLKNTSNNKKIKVNFNSIYSINKGDKNKFNEIKIKENIKEQNNNDEFQAKENEVLKALELNDDMPNYEGVLNKVYKLVEHGIPFSLVNILKKYTLEYLNENIAIVLEKNRVPKQLNEMCQEIFFSEAFIRDTYDSVFQLFEHTFSKAQLEELFLKGYTLKDIVNYNENDAYYQRNLDNVIKKKIFNFQCNTKFIDKLKDLPDSNWDFLIEDTMEEAIRKHKLKTIPSFEKFNEIFKANVLPDERVSIVKLKDIFLKSGSYNIENFNEDERKLRLRGLIKADTFGLYYTLPSVTEIIEEQFEGREKEIFLFRLEDKTYEEISDEYGLTRERIRQIIARTLLKFPRVREDKYNYIFNKYNISFELFKIIYDENETTYYYLKHLSAEANKRSIEEKEDLFEILKETSLSDFQKFKIKEFLGIKEVEGQEIILNKENVRRIFVENYMIEPITYSMLDNKMKDFLKKHELSMKFSFNNIRSFENLVPKDDKIIRTTYEGYNSLYRYYDLNLLTKANISNLSSLFLDVYGEYSSKYFYDNNLELMEELDITGYEELYSLLAKLEYKLFNGFKVTFTRFPHFIIGYNTKKDFYKEKLREISPISIVDASRYFEENYGQLYESVFSYIQLEFDNFIENNFIKFDNIKILNDENRQQILSKLNERKIFTIEEAKQIFKDFKCEDFYNETNLKSMGYIVRSYIVRHRNQSIKRYIRDLIKNNDFIPFDTPLHLKLLFSFRDFVSQFQLVQVSKKEYVTLKKFESVGVFKKDFLEYKEQVLKQMNDKGYFTLYKIKKYVYSEVLDDLGFDDHLYLSLLCSFKELRMVYLYRSCHIYT